MSEPGDVKGPSNGIPKPVSAAPAAPAQPVAATQSVVPSSSEQYDPVNMTPVTGAQNYAPVESPPENPEADAIESEIVYAIIHHITSAAFLSDLQVNSEVLEARLTADLDTENFRIVLSDEAYESVLLAQDGAELNLLVAYLKMLQRLGYDISKAYVNEEIDLAEAIKVIDRFRSDHPGLATSESGLIDYAFLSMLFRTYVQHEVTEVIAGLESGKQVYLATGTVRVGEKSVAQNDKQDQDFNYKNIHLGYLNLKVGKNQWLHILATGQDKLFDNLVAMGEVVDSKNKQNDELLGIEPEAKKGKKKQGTPTPKLIVPGARLDVNEILIQYGKQMINGQVKDLGLQLEEYEKMEKAITGSSVGEAAEAYQELAAQIGIARAGGNQILTPSGKSASNAWILLHQSEVPGLHQAVDPQSFLAACTAYFGEGYELDDLTDYYLSDTFLETAELGNDGEILTQKAVLQELESEIDTRESEIADRQALLNDPSRELTAEQIKKLTEEIKILEEGGKLNGHTFESSLSQLKLNLEEARRAYREIIDQHIENLDLECQLAVQELVAEARLEIALRTYQQYQDFGDFVSQVAEATNAKLGQLALSQKNLGKIKDQLDELATSAKKGTPQDVAAQENAFQKVASQEVLEIASQGEAAKAAQYQGLLNAVTGEDASFKGKANYSLADTGEGVAIYQGTEKTVAGEKALEPYDELLDPYYPVGESETVIVVDTHTNYAEHPFFAVVGQNIQHDPELLASLGLTNPGLTSDQNIDGQDVGAVIIRTLSGRMDETNYGRLVGHAALSGPAAGAPLATLSAPVLSLQMANRETVIAELVRGTDITPQAALEELSGLASGDYSLLLVYNQYDSAYPVQNISFVKVSAQGMQVLDEGSVLERLLRRMVELYYGLNPGHPDTNVQLDNNFYTYLSQAMGMNFKKDSELAMLTSIAYSLLRDVLKSKAWTAIEAALEDNLLEGETLLDAKNEALRMAFELAGQVISNLAQSGELSEFAMAVGQEKQNSLLDKITASYKKQIQKALADLKNFKAKLEQSQSQSNQAVEQWGAKTIANTKSEIAKSGKQVNPLELIKHENKVNTTVDQIQDGIEQDKAKKEQALKKAQAEYKLEEAKNRRQQAVYEAAGKLCEELVFSFSEELGMRKMGIGEGFKSASMYYSYASGIAQQEYKKVNNVAALVPLEKSANAKPSITVVNDQFLVSFWNGLANQYKGSSEGKPQEEITLVQMDSTSLGTWDQLLSILDTLNYEGDLYQWISTHPVAVLKLFLSSKVGAPPPIRVVNGEIIVEDTEITPSDLRAVATFMEQTSLYGTDESQLHELVECLRDAADYLEKNAEGQKIHIGKKFLQDRLIFTLGSDENKKKYPGLYNLNQALRVVYRIFDKLRSVSMQVQQEQRDQYGQSEPPQEDWASLTKDFLKYWIVNPASSLPAPAELRAPEIIDRNKIVALKEKLLLDLTDENGVTVRDQLKDLNNEKIKIKYVYGNKVQIETYDRYYFEGEKAASVDDHFILLFIDKYGALLEHSKVATLSGGAMESQPTSMMEKEFQEDPIEKLREFFLKHYKGKDFPLAVKYEDSPELGIAKSLIMTAMMSWTPELKDLPAGADMDNETQVLLAKAAHEAQALLATGKSMLFGMSASQMPLGMYLKAFLLQRGNLSYNDGLSFTDNQVNVKVANMAGRYLRGFIEKLENISDPKIKAEKINMMIWLLNKEGFQVQSLADIKKYMDILENAKFDGTFDLKYGKFPDGLVEIGQALEAFVRVIQPNLEYLGEGEEPAYVVDFAAKQAEEFAKYQAGQKDAKGVTFLSETVTAVNTLPENNLLETEKTKPEVDLSHQVIGYAEKLIEFGFLMHTMIQLPMQTGTLVQLFEVENSDSLFKQKDREQIVKSLVTMRLSFLAFQYNFIALIKSGMLAWSGEDYGEAIVNFTFAVHAIMAWIRIIKSLPPAVAKLAQKFDPLYDPNQDPAEAMRKLLLKGIAEAKFEGDAPEVSAKKAIAAQIVGNAFKWAYNAKNLAVEPITEVTQRMEDMLIKLANWDSTLGKTVEKGNLKAGFWNKLEYMAGHPQETVTIDFVDANGVPIKLKVNGADFIPWLRRSIDPFKLDGGVFLVHQLNLKTKYMTSQLLAKLVEMNVDAEAMYGGENTQAYFRQQVAENLGFSSYKEAIKVYDKALVDAEVEAMPQKMLKQQAAQSLGCSSYEEAVKVFGQELVDAEVKAIPQKMAKLTLTQNVLPIVQKEVFSFSILNKIFATNPKLNKLRALDSKEGAIDWAMTDDWYQKVLGQGFIKQVFFSGNEKTDAKFVEGLVFSKFGNNKLGSKKKALEVEYFKQLTKAVKASGFEFKLHFKAMDKNLSKLEAYSKATFKSLYASYQAACIEKVREIVGPVENKAEFKKKFKEKQGEIEKALAQLEKDFINGFKAQIELGLPNLVDNVLGFDKYVQDLIFKDKSLDLGSSKKDLHEKYFKEFMQEVKASGLKFKLHFKAMDPKLVKLEAYSKKAFKSLYESYRARCVQAVRDIIGPTTNKAEFDRLYALPENQAKIQQALFDISLEFTAEISEQAKVSADQALDYCHKHFPKLFGTLPAPEPALSSAEEGYLVSDLAESPLKEFLVKRGYQYIQVEKGMDLNRIKDFSDLENRYFNNGVLKINKKGQFKAFSLNDYALTVHESGKIILSNGDVPKICNTWAELQDFALNEIPQPQDVSSAAANPGVIVEGQAGEVVKLDAAKLNDPAALLSRLEELPGDPILVFESNEKIKLRGKTADFDTWLNSEDQAAADKAFQRIVKATGKANPEIPREYLAGFIAGRKSEISEALDKAKGKFMKLSLPVSSFATSKNEMIDRLTTVKYEYTMPGPDGEVKGSVKIDAQDAQELMDPAKYEAAKARIMERLVTSVGEADAARLFDAFELELQLAASKQKLGQLLDAELSKVYARVYLEEKAKHEAELNKAGFKKRAQIMAEVEAKAAEYVEAYRVVYESKLIDYSEGVKESKPEQKVLTEEDYKKVWTSVEEEFASQKSMAELKAGHLGKIQAWLNNKPGKVIGKGLHDGLTGLAVGVVTEGVKEILSDDPSFLNFLKNAGEVGWGWAKFGLMCGLSEQFLGWSPLKAMGTAIAIPALLNLSGADYDVKGQILVSNTAGIGAFMGASWAGKFGATKLAAKLGFAELTAGKIGGPVGLALGIAAMMGGNAAVNYGYQNYQWMRDVLDSEAAKDAGAILGSVGEPLTAYWAAGVGAGALGSAAGFVSGVSAYVGGNAALNITSLALSAGSWLLRLASTAAGGVALAKGVFGLWFYVGFEDYEQHVAETLGSKIWNYYYPDDTEAFVWSVEFVAGKAFKGDQFMNWMLEKPNEYSEKDWKMFEKALISTVGEDFSNTLELNQNLTLGLYQDALTYLFDQKGMTGDMKADQEKAAQKVADQTKGLTEQVMLNDDEKKVFELTLKYLKEHPKCKGLNDSQLIKYLTDNTSFNTEKSARALLHKFELFMFQSQVQQVLGVDPSQMGENLYQHLKFYTEQVPKAKSELEAKQQAIADKFAKDYPELADKVLKAEGQNLDQVLTPEELQIFGEHYALPMEQLSQSLKLQAYNPYEGTPLMEMAEVQKIHDKYAYFFNSNGTLKAGLEKEFAEWVLAQKPGGLSLKDRLQGYQEARAQQLVKQSLENFDKPEAKLEYDALDQKLGLVDKNGKLNLSHPLVKEAFGKWEKGQKQATKKERLAIQAEYKAAYGEAGKLQKKYMAAKDQLMVMVDKGETDPEKVNKALAKLEEAQTALVSALQKLAEADAKEKSQELGLKLLIGQWHKEQDPFRKAVLKAVLESRGGSVESLSDSYLNELTDLVDQFNQVDAQKDPETFSSLAQKILELKN